MIAAMLIDLGRVQAVAIGTGLAIGGLAIGAPDMLDAAVEAASNALNGVMP